MIDASSEKLLSIIGMGRNDNYMGNFTYRMAGCLNYLGRNVAEAGRLKDVELLITDWGSEVPLSATLPLRPEAAAITRFFYVPPELVRTVRPDGGFAPTLAANLGLRRGLGRFLLQFDVDSLMPRHSLSSLLDLLDGKLPVPFDLDRVVMYFCRHHIPWEIVQREPTTEEWDRYLLHAAGVLPRDSSNRLGGSSAGLLAHRTIWHETRAMDEHMLGQGWLDCDLALRATQKYSMVDLSFLGVNLFHMEHWPRNHRPGAAQGGLGQEKGLFDRLYRLFDRRQAWVNGIVNQIQVSLSIEANDENWGLANAKIEEARAANVAPEPPPGERPPACNREFDARKLVTELTDRSVIEHVRRNAALPIPTQAFWECLCALSWYSLRRYPQIYLEFGIQSLCGAAVVAAACPGAETYAVDSWRGGGGIPIHRLYAQLQELGYRGALHVVTGEETTAFERLKQAAEQPFRCDLVLLREELMGATAVDTIHGILDHLTPGGMIILASPTRDRFEALWRTLDARSGIARLRGASGQTGFVMTSNATSGQAELMVDFGLRRPRSRRRRVLKALKNAYLTFRMATS